MSKSKEHSGKGKKHWSFITWLVIIAVLVLIYMFGGIGIGVGFGPGKGPGQGPGDTKNSTKEPAMQPASLASHPLSLQGDDFQDLAAMVYKIKENKDPVSGYIREHLSPETKQLLGKYDGYVSDILQKALLADLNYLLREQKFYKQERFAAVNLSTETQELVKREVDGDDLVRRNRALLEESYPKDVAANYKFSFRHDRIFYRESQLSKEQFRELLAKALKQKKQGRDVYHKFIFDAASTTNKFYKDVQDDVESFGFKFQRE
jgi:hypothetical protein